MTAETSVEVPARGFAKLKLGQAHKLQHHDLGVSNSKSEPDKVAPTALGGVLVDGERIRITLAPASWTLISLMPA